MLPMFARLAPSVFILVLALKIRQTVARFRSARATGPEHARPLGELGLRYGPPAKLLTRRGVLVDIGGGRYYLDEDRYRRWRQRRRAVLAVMLVVLSLIAVAMMCGSSGEGGNGA